MRRSSSRTILFFTIGLTVVAMGFVACGTKEPEVKDEAIAAPELPGYSAMTIPADNPMTRLKVELGRQLYYDVRLSGDGSRSCYSCHLVENGLTDGKPKAIGAYGVELPRSSPTLWNIGFHSQFYWDGRSGSLEAQAKAAWSGGNMGVSGKDGRPSLDDICMKLDQIEGYRKQFQQVFGTACTPDNAVKAIAAFERTIVASDSAWIRFRRGDQNALSEAARRGYDIFKGKARCTNCHDGLLLTDLQFHNVGIGWDAKAKKFADEGRFPPAEKARAEAKHSPEQDAALAKENERLKGAFKTPTLIDIAKSAPYFHDGSVATLEEAVDLMLAGGIDNPQLDRTNLRPPVKLSKQERADLLEFLRSLNAVYHITPPPLPQ